MRLDNMKQRHLLTCAGQRSSSSSAEMASSSSLSSSPPPSVVVRVKRELLASCMTCPICNKLLNDATTISDCSHTFCRKCILEKLTDEEAKNCCPICNVYLGPVPAEKLRADHNLQDIRSKIFPSKRRRVNSPKFAPCIALPARRKERSLSSLVVNTPRVSTRKSLKTRRTKIAAKRASSFCGFSPIIDESYKESINVEDHAENPSHDRIQLSAEEAENGKESSKDKYELWKPLSCLVDVANKTKAVKPSKQTSDIKEEELDIAETEVHRHKIKVKEHHNQSIMQEEVNGSTATSPAKCRGRRKKRDLETSVQTQDDATGAACEKRAVPIWISLVPSLDQKGDSAFPQTSGCYLRIKDGSSPVSVVLKYLVKKHNLASESEVLITCSGHTVGPATALHSLADLWLLSRPPSQRVQATVGTSAKDFVMVLNYGRKASAP